MGKRNNANGVVGLSDRNTGSGADHLLDDGDSIFLLHRISPMGGEATGGLRAGHGDTRCHRGTPTTGTGAILSATALAAGADCRQGNCVHLSLDPAESPIGQQSLTGGAGRRPPPGTSAVAKAGRRRVGSPPDVHMGRPSGECRLSCPRTGRRGQLSGKSGFMYRCRMVRLSDVR